MHFLQILFCRHLPTFVWRKLNQKLPLWRKNYKYEVCWGHGYALTCVELEKTAKLVKLLSLVKITNPLKIENPVQITNPVKIADPVKIRVPVSPNKLTLFCAASWTQFYGSIK